PTCPVTPEDCDNVVPDVLCPCPLILGFFVNEAGESVLINLSVPIDVSASDTIQFGLSTGGYVEGEVVALSEDGKQVEVTFEDFDPGNCDQFTTIFCDNTMGCFAEVVQ